jgi:membrane protein
VTTAALPATALRAFDRAWHALWASLRLFSADQGLSWGGAIGLYLFLSVPPLIVAGVYLGGLVVPSSQAEQFVIEQVAKYLPAQQDLLQGIVTTRPAGLMGGLVSLIFLLVSGSRAFAALSGVINVIWQEVQELTFWRRQLLRLGMLVVSLGLLLLAAVAEAGMGGLAHGGGDQGQLWIARWQILPTLLLGLFLFVAYKTLPRDPVDWRHAIAGAVIATVGIRIAQAGTGYLSAAGAMRTSYGELAGVALIATWALVVGVIVVYGAVVTAMLGGKGPVEPEQEGRPA